MVTKIGGFIEIGLNLKVHFNLVSVLHSSCDSLVIIFGAADP